MAKYFEKQGKKSSGGASSEDMKQGYTNETDQAQDDDNYNPWAMNDGFGGFAERPEGEER